MPLHVLGDQAILLTCPLFQGAIRLGIGNVIFNNQPGSLEVY